jgi:phosphoribosylanthranilate isomerase
MEDSSVIDHDRQAEAVAQSLPWQVKICGITTPEQGRAIAHLGADLLGFICVQASPRYVTPAQIRAIAQAIPSPTQRIGVFVNAAIDEIVATVAAGGLTGVQLHGEESPEFCDRLRQALAAAQSSAGLPPTSRVSLIKAFRLQHPAQISQTEGYGDRVDAFLLDAYHPTHHGGTGLTLDWQPLQTFAPPVPWFLAGGLTPDNVQAAIALAQPHGIDLSSGVERSPGQKDLQKVAHLFTQLRSALADRSPNRSTDR